MFKTSRIFFVFSLTALQVLVMGVLCPGPLWAAPGIFGIGVVDIEDTSVNLVFNTSAFMQATVEVQNDQQQPVSTFQETDYYKIHSPFNDDGETAIGGLHITGLNAGQTYTVVISAQSSSGQTAGPKTFSFRAGRRSAQHDTYPGYTRFGSGWDDQWAVPTGLKACRLEIAWSHLNNWEGHFDQAKMNEKIADVQAMLDAGIEPVILIDYCKDWAQTNTDDIARWRRPEFGPPDKVSDWENLLTFIMSNFEQAFPGYPFIYEIWNEPDAGYLADPESGGEYLDPHYQNLFASPGGDKAKEKAFWLRNHYLPLVMAARNVADQINPAIKIINGGWNHDYHGSRGQLLFEHGMDRYIQKYCFHIYSGPGFAKWKYWFAEKYVHFIDSRAFSVTGADMPLVITEWGMQAQDNPETEFFNTHRDRQLFILKSSFEILRHERFEIAEYFKVKTDSDFLWGLVRGDYITPGYHSYKWICQTFSAKPYRIVPASTTGQHVESIAVKLQESQDVYLALWQGYYNTSTQQIEPLPEQQVQVSLPEMPAGSYLREKIGLDGSVAASEIVQAGSEGLAWQESIPEAADYAESGMVIYHFSILSSEMQALPDRYVGIQNQTLSVPAPGVLGNDTPTQTLHAELVGDSTYGTLHLHADGSFSYIPVSDFVGRDYFSYRASNGLDYSEPVQVTLDFDYGGLVGYWPCEEGTGPVATDIAAGNDGLLSSDEQWSSGIQDGGLAFDGASQLVTTGSDDLRLAPGITLSCWFRTDTTDRSQPQMILWQGSSAGNGWGSHEEMHLTVGTNNNLAFFYGGLSSESVFIAGSEDFTDTESWHHLAAVVAEAGGPVARGELFLDGRLIGSDTGTRCDRSDWDTPLRFGGPGSSTPARYFDGQLDEIRIYDIALTQGQIENLYRRGLGRACLVDWPADTDGNCRIDTADLDHFILNWLNPHTLEFMHILAAHWLECNNADPELCRPH